MDSIIENHYQNVLTGMAANTSGLLSNKVKKEKRKNDCYTHVANVIKCYKDNEEVLNGNIRVYTLGNIPAHCVLINNKKEIIADDFDSARKKYHKDTGYIEYEALDISTNPMLGKGMELNKNSFEIPVKEYLKLVENVETLIDYKKTNYKELNFIPLLNEGLTVNDALDFIDSLIEKPKQDLPKQKTENIQSKKIKP